MSRDDKVVKMLIKIKCWYVKNWQRDVKMLTRQVLTRI